MILSWFIYKMEPWPLFHLSHKESPVAYEALPACPLPGQPQLLLVFLLLLTLWSDLLFLWLPCFTSSVVLCHLPRTWFLQVAVWHNPSPPSSLTFPDASLDQPLQPCDLLSLHVTLQIFPILVTVSSIALATNTLLC